MNHWALQDTYYIRPPHQAWDTQQMYLSYRNKSGEAAKMGRQKNMPQMKEEEKSPKKKKWNRGNWATRCRVQINGYTDAKRIKGKNGWT